MVVVACLRILGILLDSDENEEEMERRRQRSLEVSSLPDAYFRVKAKGERFELGITQRLPPTVHETSCCLASLSKLRHFMLTFPCSGIGLWEDRNPVALP
jgi:hypothetical protein